MNTSKRILPGILILLVLNFRGETQTKTAVNELSKMQTWQVLDYTQDTVYGTSVNKAYKELLKGKKGHPVIVAVIDEGVDITHEDLQGHIWINKKEIAGNGIDDDKNGYTDDVHGWNFLGGKDGKMMYATSSEADREYFRLLPVYQNIKDSSQADNKEEYQYFLRAKKKHLEDSVGRGPGRIVMVSRMINRLVAADSLLQKAMQKSLIYFNNVESFQPKDSLEDATKKFVLNFYNRTSPSPKSMSLDSVVRFAMETLNKIKDEQSLYEQLGNDPNQLRKQIVGDNPFDINDRNYGNNVVGDKYADHGTHCSGIISAVRNNSIGMDGIADNVLIMPLRAVGVLHVGDELDKDIALAIRYAVDNCAKIISMSFGKNFSPQKKWVDDAVKYAEKKGVLLVHAAMNDHTNNDSIVAYPTPDFLASSGRAKNVITVGAISIDTGFALPAIFSNYGQKQVDVFAPGVDIYSCVYGNKYQPMSGTSMATPVVAGVAALILEYYPHLSAVQIKDIILTSVTPLKGKIVYKPGSKEKVDFSTLCVSGGVVNAYNALKLAAQYKVNRR